MECSQESQLHVLAHKTDTCNKYLYFFVNKVIILGPYPYKWRHLIVANSRFLLPLRKGLVPKLNSWGPICSWCHLSSQASSETSIPLSGLAVIMCSMLWRHSYPHGPSDLPGPFLCYFWALLASEDLFSSTGGSDSKESAHNAGGPNSITRLRRCPGEGNGNPSSILAWRISRTEEPGRLWSMGL